MLQRLYVCVFVCVCMCVCESKWFHLSCHSKFEFRKMKVVICITISTELAFKPALLWRWKISNIKTALYVLKAKAQKR